MKRLALCLIALTLWIQASAQSVQIGTTEAELIGLKGKPVSRTVVGTKAIYRWNDMEVKLTEGKVVSAVPRDLQRESEIREHNDLRNAEHRNKIESEKDRIRSENEAAARTRQITATQDGPSFFDRTMAREAERVAEKKKTDADEPRRRAEREADFARRESLRVETNRLKADTRQAYKNGDKRLSGILAEEYKAKTREQDAVNKKIKSGR